MPGLKGFMKTTASLVKPVWTSCNELALNIRTEPPRQNGRAGTSGRPWWRGDVFGGVRHDDNFHYATIDYWNVRKVLQALEPRPDDVFYDIGCGMGRILCVVARRKLRKCVGVELSPLLCEVARRNAGDMRGRKTPIEIVCGDAAKADLSDGTIYFMFNPFGVETLRDTLENIRTSLRGEPRRVRIVYYHSAYESVLAASGWLERVSQFESFGGLPISFWENRRPEGIASAAAS